MSLIKFSLIAFSAIIVLSSALPTQDDGLQSKKLTVVTSIGAPYVMVKEDQEGLEGNDRYEGFIVDLMNKISEVLGFEYDLKEVADRRYGSKNADGSWNGMIGEVVSGDADIAASDLTITSKREEAIDFTMPIMNLGIGILYKKKDAKQINNLGDSMTFLCDALSNQATRRNLIKSGGKMPDPEVQSIEDLLGKPDLAFGQMQNSVTNSFFTSSSLPLYKQIANEYTAVRNMKEGVERVKSGGYALFMESPSIEYVMAKDCDLYQVGGLLDSKYNGLAVAKDSPLRALLNDAILQLQEAGFIANLKTKWWSRDSSCL